MAETDTTDYADRELTPYTRYWYRVSALSEEGVEGEPSDSMIARTLDGSPPGVPSGGILFHEGGDPELTPAPEPTLVVPTLHSAPVRDSMGRLLRFLWRKT